jgi:hypothetical protein
MMVALLVYGYCVGQRSSRVIERKTYEDVAFRVLAGGNHPDHTCISEFRRIHLDALAELFVVILRMCQKAGLVKLGHVALDGTKIKANASKHKAMSYERMKAEEARLAALVGDLLREAEESDAAEDARYGKEKRGDELPDELRHPARRLERIRALRAELEAEAAAQTEAKAQAEHDDEDDPPGGADDLPSHQIPTTLRRSWSGSLVTAHRGRARRRPTPRQARRRQRRAALARLPGAAGLPLAWARLAQHAPSATGSPCARG